MEIYIINKGFCWEDNLRDRFAVTQYPRLGVKIEFGKNALPISAAVSNLAQHPHQHQERRGKERGSRGDESRNKVRNAQQTSPLKKRRDKNLPSMWFYYNFHNFISSSILGGFVLHVLKTCCCRAVSPNPYKEGYSRHQSLGKILQIFSLNKNQHKYYFRHWHLVFCDTLFWERLSTWDTFFLLNVVVPGCT